MRPSRPHRLPQRLDYALIPAPLDLTLPIVDEKADLPAIIVTPSSPSSVTDFSIAFLAPPPSPPLLKRISTTLKLKKQPQINVFSQLKPRTAFLIFIPIVLLMCHLLTHQLAALRPRLSFDTHAHLQYSLSTPEVNANMASNMHAARVEMGGLGFGVGGREEQEVRVAVTEGHHHDST